MAIPSVFLIHTCSISSRINEVVQELRITTVSGTFQVGETVTGGTSESTGTIYAVAATYLQLTDISADFQSGETLTGSDSHATATSTSANYDATDSFGIPITVAETQSSVSCRFVGFKGDLMRAASGEISEKLPAVLFSSNISVYPGDKITGDNQGYTSTFTVQSVKTVYEATQSTVYLIKAFLEAVD